MIALVSLIASVTCFLQEHPTPPDTKITLPKDQKAVILSLTFEGGFTPAPRTRAPVVEVLADGTVRIPSPTPGGEERTDRLEGKELDALLHFVIVEQRLLDFVPQKARDEMEKALGTNVPRVADGADTVIRLRLEKRAFEARFNALGVFARYEQAHMLRRLYAVERRLRGLEYRVELGGGEKTARLLKAVNARLAQEHPRAAALTIEDVKSITLDQPRPGTTSVYIQRRTGEAEIRTSIEIPPEGPPRIEIQVSPLR